MDTDTLICKNCGNQFHGSFCNQCGQKQITERYTVKHIINVAFSSFDLHRGVLFTAKSLFVDPGKVINDYLGGKTKCYYNPISYLLIIASVYAILMVWFNAFDDNLENMNDVLGMEQKQTQLQSIINLYIKRYISFISILILPFYSIASKWIFKKHKLNYAEHLIINSYAIAQYLLIFTILLIIFIYVPGFISIMMPLGFVVFVAYYTYASKRIYNISFIVSLYSSVTTFLIGIILFYIFTALVSIIVFSILMLLGVDLQQYM